jgi:hypothetical protein
MVVPDPAGETGRILRMTIAIDHASGKDRARKITGNPNARNANFSRINGLFNDRC